MARSKGTRSKDIDPEHAAGAPEAPFPSRAPELPQPAPFVALAPAARRFLIGSTALLGPAFGWAALRLPWRPEAPLALLLWALAAANVCTLVALLGSGRRLRLALGVLVALSFAAAPVMAGAIVISSVVMVRMYGALGWGLSVALGAIGWLLLLATLPIAFFGLRCLRRHRVPGHLPNAA